MAQADWFGHYKLFYLFSSCDRKARGYSDGPGVRPSIQPSLNSFMSALLLKYRWEYFDDTLQLCRTYRDDVSRIKTRALALIRFKLSPL